MTVMEDYRLQRQAQDERFTARPGAGAVDASLTQTEEYRAYFGQGEWDGGGTEQRVTLKSHLTAVGRENRLAREWVETHPVYGFEPITLEAAFYLPGSALRELADDGDPNAVAELERRAAKRAAKRAARA